MGDRACTPGPGVATVFAWTVIGSMRIYGSVIPVCASTNKWRWASLNFGGNLCVFAGVGGRWICKL